MASRRTSGILLHITSLPSRYGIGDLGPAAYDFADFLKRSKQRLWQMLPVGPVGPGASPYSSPSTFAGSPLVIGLEPLVEKGLLTEKELTPLEKLSSDHVDFERLVPRKLRLLRTAFGRFDEDASHADTTRLERFRTRHSEWLDDYALYAALKSAHDQTPWTEWPQALAQRRPAALKRAREQHSQAVRMHTFWQYLFHRQWTSLKTYCNARDIRLFGDLPIYVAHDSADVWAHQELFQLDEEGDPVAVAGVPPDYFSPEGQLWGNPLYRWKRMQKNDYAWWTQRMRHALNRFDLVRLDHFRGFEAYWRVPADQDTAVDGEWKDGPGASFFETLESKLGELPVVAEDLGLITDEVEALRDRFDFPGMAVLQFAFEGSPTNEFLPHNYRRNLVAYPGTHDNNTTVGWWRNDLSDDGKEFARSYLDLPSPDVDIHTESLRALMASVAQRVVTPLQDVLGLGTAARMNNPGEPNDNWSWRVTREQIRQLSKKHVSTLREFTRLYGRLRDYDE